MVDAPERIVLLSGETHEHDRELNTYIASQPNSVEYVRADLVATLEAEVSRLTALLDEAKVVARPFADVSDLVDAETEGISETDEFCLEFCGYLMASWPLSLFRAARAFAEKAGA